MKTTLTTTTKVILELNPKDAYFLKAYIQNPLSEDEDKQTKNFREKLFNSIPSFDLLLNNMDES